MYTKDWVLNRCKNNSLSVCANLDIVDLWKDGIVRRV